MGYTSNATITNLQQNAQFHRITNTDLHKSHVHNMAITHEAPNYQQN